MAPLFIGDGRTAVRIASRLRLRDCLRLRHRAYRAALDILFDCDLRSAAVPNNGQGPALGAVRRIL